MIEEIWGHESLATLYKKGAPFNFVRIHFNFFIPAEVLKDSKDSTPLQQILAGQNQLSKYKFIC